MNRSFFLLLLPLTSAACCAHTVPVPAATAAAALQTAAAPMPISPASAAAASSDTPLPRGPIRLQAAQASLTASTMQTKIPGFGGAGYAGEFQAEGAKAVWIIPHARAGLYRIAIRYATPYGAKGYSLVVNGARLSGMFADTKGAWATQPAGQLELRDGANMVAIERGWGCYDINSLDLIPAGAPPALKAPPFAPSDPQATPQARALLHTLAQTYGVKTLSGQYDADDTQYLQAVTGQTPAIMGGDLIDYSPSRVARGADAQHTSERLLQAAKSGQIVTLSWHWNAPSGLIDNANAVENGQTVNRAWYKGFNTDATTFDVQRALADPHSADCAGLLRDMDAIAAQLQKFSDAGVPVLWRPLHEAEGGWFWWGAKGPDAYKQLWRLMHDRLTQVHHLHNLVWVYSSGTKPEWYPGDQYVDVVGVDSYPSDVSDPLSSTWDTLLTQYGGRKLLALTEFGGVPDIAKMRRYGVRWAYFVSWSGSLGPRKMSAADLKRIYREPSVVNQAALTAATPTPQP